MYDTLMNNFMLRLEATGGFPRFFVQGQNEMVEIITPDGRVLAVMDREAWDEDLLPLMKWFKQRG